MADVSLVVGLIAVYVVLVLLFHQKKYPSPLVSSGNLKRECGEAVIIFGVYIVIYWSQNLIRNLLKVSYLSDFAWTIGVFILLGASLCLLVFVEKIVRRRNLSAVGFKFPINRKFLLVFTGLIVAYSVWGISLLVSHGIQSQYFYFYLASGCIIGPLAEEIVFRGLIQARFEAALGTVKSWLLSGVLFAVYHYVAWFLIEGKTVTLFSTFSLTSLIFVLLFGMLAGVLFAKTRSLLPPFLLHAVHNFVAFFL